MRCSSRFHAARCANVSEIECAAKLAIDSDEQVLVERGGDAQRIVVGELQLALGFDEIGAKQQQIAGPQDIADSTQECQRRRRIEVADVRSEKQHEHRAAARRARWPRGASPTS